MTARSGAGTPEKASEIDVLAIRSLHLLSQLASLTLLPAGERIPQAEPEGFDRNGLLRQPYVTRRVLCD